MANFKYQKLYDWVKTQIQTGVYASGDRIPTETALMQQFAVSRDTIRTAVKHLEADGYLQKIQGSGTFVTTPSSSAAPAAAASKKIGVIMRQTDSYIFPNILNAIYATLSQHGYSAVTLSTAGNLWLERIALQQALNEDYDGLIIEPTKSALPSPNHDLYQKIYQTKPAVLLHARFSDIPFSAITAAYAQGEYLLTKYLLEQGHREIAFFCKIDDYTGIERYRGYMQAFHEFSLPYPQENVIFFSAEDFPMIFSANLSPRIRQVLEHSSAAICHTDEFSYHLYNCLKLHNIDIPIAGYDEARMAEHICALTITHPKEEIGVAAAEGILQLIQSPDRDISFEFEAKLIVRSPCPFPSE